MYICLSVTVYVSVVFMYVARKGQIKHWEGKMVFGIYGFIVSV
jgi:hypothetical protein